MYKKYFYNNFLFNLIFIIFILLIKPSFIKNTKLGKIKNLNNKTLISPIFNKLDLTKRPLNFYIIANGKHAIVLNKSLPSSENNINKIVDYRISQPPFQIKNRGSIILLNENSLNWHFGYPSLLQMLAASGHTTIAMEGSNVEKIKEAINWEELHNILILGDGNKGSQLALELIEKVPRIKKELNAVMLINPPKILSNKIEDFSKEENNKTGKNKLFWILLKKEKEIKEEFQQENLKEINFEWETKKKESIEKLTQIIVNFLDFIHSR